MTDILYHTEDELVNDPTIVVKPKSTANNTYNAAKYTASPLPYQQLTKTSNTNNRFNNDTSNRARTDQDTADTIQYHTASDLVSSPLHTGYSLFATPQTQLKSAAHAARTASKAQLVQQLRSNYNVPQYAVQPHQHHNDDVIDLTDDTVPETPVPYNERKRKHTSPLLDENDSVDDVKYVDSDSEMAATAELEQQQRIAEYKRLYNIVDTVKLETELQQSAVQYIVQKNAKQHEMYLQQQRLLQQQIDEVTAPKSQLFNFRDFSDILSEIEQQQRYDTIIPEHALIYNDMLNDLISETVHRAHKTLPLTSTQLQLADQLLKRTPASELICELSGVEVKGSDIRCLAGLSWLNDEVINCYLKLLQARCDAAKQYKVWFYNTFFYAKLADGAADTYNYNAVRRWSKTQKVDITGLDMLIVPVHVHGNHWTLARLNFMTKTAEYYDSLHGAAGNTLKYLRQYVQDEAKTYKNNASYDMCDWQNVSINTARQSNGSDCGVFTLMFANYLSTNIQLVPPYAFTYENMPYFRQRIALELKYKQVM